MYTAGVIACGSNYDGIGQHSKMIPEIRSLKQIARLLINLAISSIFIEKIQYD